MRPRMATAETGYCPVAGCTSAPSVKWGKRCFAHRFYVRASTRKGVVVGYGVFDSVGGMESEHAMYEVAPGRPVELCLHLANKHRDDMNMGAK